MGKHMPDIDLFSVVVNGNNQAIFVSRDVEHGKLSYLVYEGKRDPQIDKRCVVRFANDGKPMVQRNPCIGMFASELDQPSSRDDMHTETGYLILRYWSSRETHVARYFNSRAQQHSGLWKAV
jgi:hypothetical protein